MDKSWAQLWPEKVRAAERLPSEKRIERYNRAVRRLNCNLQKPDGRYSICDGSVECPVCGKDHLTFGDPDEWTRNANPARLKRAWDVSGYWPGMAQCCGLLIAPDFEQRCIVVDEAEYRRAKARVARSHRKKRDEDLASLQPQTQQSV